MARPNSWSAELAYAFVLNFLIITLYVPGSVGRVDRLIRSCPSGAVCVGVQYALAAPGRRSIGSRFYPGPRESAETCSLARRPLSYGSIRAARASLRTGPESPPLSDQLRTLIKNGKVICDSGSGLTLARNDLSLSG